MGTEPGCPMSDSGDRFPRTGCSEERKTVWAVDWVAGPSGFGYDSQTFHRHNNHEVGFLSQTEDEVTLGEKPVHQSDGNHCGTLTVHIRNNPKVCCHFQSQGGVTLDGILIHQSCGT